MLCELTVAAVVGSDLANTSPCRRWQASSGLAEEHQIPCCLLGPFLAPTWEKWNNTRRDYARSSKKEKKKLIGNVTKHKVKTFYKWLSVYDC